MLGAFMTIIYLVRVFNAVFMGNADRTEKEGSKGMVFAVVLLAVLSLVGGLAIYYPSQAAAIATTQMLGAIR
jgi:NADH:ubiquinone oxidoreductase subunit 5 (subunit L)/multisubunit Na+/H+ antiporter MnhA subunit